MLCAENNQVIIVHGDE